MKGKPLRTVLLYSSGHLGSKIVFNMLQHMPEIELVGVMQAKSIPVSKSGKSILKKYLKSIGWRFALILFLQWLVLKSVFIFLSIFPSYAKNPLQPPKKIAKRLGIPTLYCSDINSERGQHFISALEPDIVISAYFSQIIGDTILKIPKHGILNIHPGWLPKYRGSLSYFWVLKNREDSAGVSVHWMDEGIDTGSVLARKKFKVRRGSTQQQVMIETALHGSRLVQRIARKLAKGQKPKPLKIDKEEAHYYAMPTEADYAHYARHRHFFKPVHMIKVIVRGIKIRKIKKNRRKLRKKLKK